MIRTTGGSAVGAISTRSVSFSSAAAKASLNLTTPMGSPSIPIKRTSGAVISRLMRCNFSVAIFLIPLKKQ
jgi:hypothetical protein